MADFDTLGDLQLEGPKAATKKSWEKFPLSFLRKNFGEPLSVENSAPSSGAFQRESRKTYRPVFTVDVHVACGNFIKSSTHSRGPETITQRVWAKQKIFLPGRKTTALLFSGRFSRAFQRERRRFWAICHR